MENPTQFNLETSVRKWNDDLAAQPALTPEARNELETHLRDTVKELCECGINPEEAFWLACRRVGPPCQVGEEYAKENPRSLWKTRAFWVTSAMLVAWIIQGALAGIGGILGLYQLHHPFWIGQTELVIQEPPISRLTNGPAFPFHSARAPHVAPRQNREGAPWWVDGLRNGLQNPEAALVLGTCGAIILTALISRRPGATTARAWRLVFRSRGHVLLIGLLTVIAIFVLERWSLGVGQSIQIVLTEPLDYTSSTASDSLSKLTFPLTLVALITWLSPSTSGKRISKTSWISRLTRV